MVLSQGVQAVVTLNEDFEVFISTEQYKVGCHAANALSPELAPSPIRVTGPLSGGPLAGPASLGHCVERGI